jgi:histone H3/H4
MISLLSLERIAKKAGVKRISKQALEELREVVMEYGSDLAEQAVRLSRHANRRTVMEDDILFVAGKKKE